MQDGCEKAVECSCRSSIGLDASTHGGRLHDPSPQVKRGSQAWASVKPGPKSTNNIEQRLTVISAFVAVFLPALCLTRVRALSSATKNNRILALIHQVLESQSDSELITAKLM